MGIGGAGVSALVPLLRRAGATVTGCDSSESGTTRMLRAQGISISLGHDAAHVAGVDVVVHTAAVAADHPELVAARARGLRVQTRGECLAELMRGYRVVAVAGSHGKTSTTWFLGHLLQCAGVDPVVMVGGTVASLSGGTRPGAGRWFVAEVDESDGSFARTAPEIAIVTNLDHEHLCHYGSFAHLVTAFNAWLRTVPAHGRVILGEGPWPNELFTGVVATVVRCRRYRAHLTGDNGSDSSEGTASFTPAPPRAAEDWWVDNLALGAEGSSAVFCHRGGAWPVAVPIPGAHMVANALCAGAAARAISPQVDLGSLGQCERVGRRFTVHGHAAGVRVVEDYGHHPTEVRATVSAARLGAGRVHVLFQPHRYTRTRDCFTDFTAAFDQVARLALLPVYGASELPIAGATSEALAAAIGERRGETDDARRDDDGAVDSGSRRALREWVRCSEDRAELVRWLVEGTMDGDTILVLGAGDVGALAPQVLVALQGREVAKAKSEVAPRSRKTPLPKGGAVRGSTHD
jgi:UDP-N-acetylmuramate--alanine ligase